MIDRLHPKRWGVMVFMLIACSRETVSSVSEPASEATALGPTLSSESRESEGLVLPYPPAAWRLANSAEVDRTALWISQILIRHKDAREEVSFNLGYWNSVPPLPTRTRDEALSLAESVAAKAAAEPRRFAELAREYSEDLPRRDEGGALGSVQGSLLMLWPQVLDALAAIEPGQPSRVVETRYGFHILLRSLPPPEQVLAGAHIVIGHADAHWLGAFARNGLPARSRDEAWALAQDLYHRVKAEPTRFRELVEQYSDHRDAIVGGDFGAWNTREPTAYTIRPKRLLELAVGEVGAPVETHLGFEIIQRTPPRPRPQQRARILVFPEEQPSVGPPQPLQRATSSAFAEARAVAEKFSRDPLQFDQFAAEAAIFQWEDGRYVPGLSLLFKQLQVGEVTPTPVDSEFGYIVAKRLEPLPVVPVAYHSELPSPTKPDLEEFASKLSPEGAEAFTRLFAEEVQRELGLTGPAADRLRSLHELNGRILADTPPEVRVSVFDDISAGVRQLLDDDGYERYRSAFERAMIGALLGTPPSLGF